MKKRLYTFNLQCGFLVLCLFCAGLFFQSCDDKDINEGTPEWLGESIYDYLETQGNFTCFTRIIEALDYKEVLSRTGSKTLFVADDDAFRRFFDNNEWGVSRFEDLSEAQMKVILNSAMINNAYLIALLSNTEGPTTGQALRRPTAIAVIDTIDFEMGHELPSGHYWDRFRDKGILLAKDNTTPPMLHFLQPVMDYKGITDEDFSIIFNGRARVTGDAYVFDKKVIEKDITCKNGYIHVLEDVLIPPSNMAEVVRNTDEVSIFSEFMQRFSAPYYDEGLTQQYRFQHQDFNDSVFVKKFFATNSAGNSPNLQGPDNVNQAGYFSFDPGWNTYSPTEMTSMYVDMGVIFAPSNATLQDYFNTGGGKFLKDRYGTWENVPNEVLSELVKNHMKVSFTASLPSNFENVLDDAKDPMGVQIGDVQKTYLANNGVIYVVDKVYAPASYVAVTAPTLVGENMKIFNWAVKQLEFDAYLLSMDAYYSYFVPTDEALRYYVDPVSLASRSTNTPRVLEFWYDEEKVTVEAYAREYNPATGEVGAYMEDVVISTAEILDRLEDLLDYHIVIGNVEDGRSFYRTKGGGNIEVKGSGSSMQAMGGLQIEQNMFSKVETIYDQTAETNGRGNGKTYTIDMPLQPSLKSVYTVMKENENFSKFFELLNGSDADGKYSVFTYDASFPGIDEYNVEFLSTYHYTLYVPTNDAVQKAIDNGLPTWDDISRETDAEVRDEMMQTLNRFLRYHFQDNAVYIDGQSVSSSYETATLNTNTGRFYTIDVNGTGNNLVLTTASGKQTQVRKADNLYNIMARDLKFNSSFTTIETSAFIVIHQIEDVLYFD